jgi:hypothetical protein
MRSSGCIDFCYEVRSRGLLWVILRERQLMIGSLRKYSRNLGK